MPDPIQRAAATVLAVLTLPLVLLLVFAIRLESPGPALYRATRVGARGRLFTCYKLRSLAWTADAGPRLTVAKDARITRVGRVLRALHLDELPQLWNVVRGEMRLVGPRPEDPKFVDFAIPDHREVFKAVPGITGLTQLLFEDEGELLDHEDPERSYRERVLPQKLAMDRLYLSRRSTRLDLRILARTALLIMGRDAPTMAEVESWLYAREATFR